MSRLCSVAPVSETVTSSVPHNDSSSSRGVLRALAFWACLLLSASLFAATVLAPKVVTWRHLSEEHAANRRFLEHLQQQLDEDERLAAALERDPEYVEAMIGVTPADTTVIPDALSPRKDVNRGLPSKAPDEARWTGMIVSLSTLATSRGHRAGWLLVAAGLLILAFTVLSTVPDTHDSPSRHRRRAPRHWLRHRYSRSRV